MTLTGFIRAVLKRWPIVLVGALITCAFANRAIGSDGAFWTRTEVVFLHPADELSPNSLSTISRDVVVTAGIVGKRISGPGRVTKYASPDVDLVGVGLRDGWWVRLPDTGGQWSTNFESQELVVEVVGRDAEGVRERRNDLVAQIRDELSALQRDAGVPIESRITIRMPDEAGISYVRGSKSRALGMTLLLGLGCTATALLLLEARSRSRARSAVGDPGVLTMVVDDAAPPRPTVTITGGASTAAPSPRDGR